MILLSQYIYLHAEMVAQNVAGIDSVKTIGEIVSLANSLANSPTDSFSL